MTHWKFFEFFQKTDPIYLTILVFLIFYRILVLVLFNFTITDGDQTVMWQGVRDFSQGIFHEPRFYGQDYDSMIEALLAVPLYWLGIQPYKALPAITNLMAISPFIIFSWLTLKKGKKIQAYFILALSLFLAPEYDLITSMPRGFINGIFFASLGAIALFYPGNKRWFLFSGFFYAFGYAINPNSLLISIPCLFYQFLLYKKEYNFYIFSGIGLIAGEALNLAANYFYIINPAFNLHRTHTPHFSFQQLLSAFSNLDWHFNCLTPFFWKMGWLSLAFFVLISWIFFYRKQFKEAWVVIATLAFIIGSLGFDRMFAATPSVFFSYSRMYLAIPILLAIFISFMQFRTNGFKYYFLILVAGFTLQKSVNLEDTIFKSTIEFDPIINVCRISDLQKECFKRQLLAERFNISLESDQWNMFYTLATYGCPFCESGFPKTLYPPYERRTWRMREEEKQVHKNILIVSGRDNPDSLIKKSTALKIDMIRIGDYYIIRNNCKPTIQLLRSLGLKIRDF
ncbi:MAG: hypothetical protein Q8867_05575 [Bacteroidota bacterium]|nr:hypothetical protein [Bacteroidota bacterium]